MGINLSPHKACNMDCVYCQVDRSVKPAVRTVDLDRMEQELTELLGRAASGEIFLVEPFASAPESLHRLADDAAGGRWIALGGGGYNVDVLPRAFVVHRALAAQSAADALVLMQEPEFDPEAAAASATCRLPSTMFVRSSLRYAR